MKYINKEPKPVDKIELNEKHIKLRIILFILSFCVVIVCAILIFIGFSKEKSGWTRIEANPKTALSCEEDFVLSYDLGNTKEGATAEARKISAIYTEALEKTYMLFDAYHCYDGIYNVCYINEHINEVIEVDEILYKAMSETLSIKKEILYMGPIYRYYQDIFSASNADLANSLDPYNSIEVQSYFKSLLEFINTKSIHLELLENNQIKLNVSEEYASFARENEITSFIDFSWLRNAYIIDYVAEELINNKYINGYISTYDGYFKNLDIEQQYNYTTDILDTVEGFPSLIGQFVSKGSISIVQFRSFMYYKSDISRYYKMKDDSYRHLYIDSKDGLSKSSVDSLTSYSFELSCSQIALLTADTYISEEFIQPKSDKINYLWSEEETIKYTDANLHLENLYNFNGIVYKGEYLE